ncbi:DUF262 domain-containing protein [Agriterribacter sp.]|uniref:DUF262 domain-containing protein n=1 Tax=Agriterribacter sp. TaxID=2821509 RepID=UPI002C1C5910|nr:DUF262 domain-containing protein [Agriterribacter sp.]HRP58060.1 DUF262 domain-containing protein [Agriterribacter sp.]
MTERNKSSKLADRLFPEIEELNLDILNIPPEKRRLNTETYDFTVSTLVDYLNNGHIVIPEFQRGYVWNRAQASRLIESLIINCPIPVVFLSQNPDETLAVIDGNQRLNSIKLFIADEFVLRGLTAYPELEGYTFSALDPRFQRHIQNRTVRCIVILKDTHPQIKFDVFERLNTGSVKLNAHELRHGIHAGPFMDKLEKLGNNKLFRELTLNKTDKRMKADELVLRFLSFADNWRNYTKPLVSFLNNYSENNRNINEQRLNEIELEFTSTLKKVNLALDRLAFKTYDTAYKNAKFNAALFDAQMISFYEINPSDEKIQKLTASNFVKKNQEFIENEEFNKYISSGTTDKNSVINRITEYKIFLTKLLQ